MPHALSPDYDFYIPRSKHITQKFCYFFSFIAVVFIENCYLHYTVIKPFADQKFLVLF